MDMWHIKRKDLDNLVKFVLDALNEHAYYDDSQISLLTAGKLYVDQPPTPSNPPTVTNTDTDKDKDKDRDRDRNIACNNIEIIDIRETMKNVNSMNGDRDEQRVWLARTQLKIRRLSTSDIERVQ